MSAAAARLAVPWGKAEAALGVCHCWQVSSAGKKHFTS